jgi:aminoglycoside phosphotransferase (APT) family kinase protein
MSGNKPGSTTPWRRDPAQLAEGLAAWARERKGPAATVTEVRAPASGMANETILFRLDEEPLVARLAPLPGSPFPTFPTFDLDFQRRCMEVVQRHTKVPVPGVVHLEDNDGWLGAPFLVLRCIDGVVPSDNPPYVFDGWLLEGDDEQRQRFEVASIALLVELHTITPATEDLTFLEPAYPGATLLQRLLGFQRGYYEWACEGEPVPLLEEAFRVLQDTLPENDRAALSWGDSRIGNVLYRDFEPVAVLDWEMATLAPPEVDLGWMTMMHAFFQELAEGYGFPGMPDLLRRERTVTTYEGMAGYTLEDLAWYEALAALRFAIISIRTSLRSVAFGLQEPPAHPDDVIMFQPLFRRLLEEL